MGTGSRKSGAVCALQFFAIFYVKSSSHYSLVHILPTSSSKSVPSAALFSDFEVQIKLPPRSCALFADNFPRSSPEPEETETATPGAALPQNTGVRAGERFTREFTRVRVVTLPSYLMMGG